MRVRGVLVTAAAVVLTAACTGAPEAPPAAEPSETGTPLQAYDVGSAALERSPFCDRIAAPAVQAALDGAAADAEAWADGERVALTDAVTDVAHEHGCRYTRTDAEAAAWVFAPPVTPARAGELVREARATTGCRVAPDAAPLGRPSVALVCDDGERAAYRGLLGDTWVACEVSRSEAPDDLLDLAGRWCVAVVEAARTRSD